MALPVDALMVCILLYGLRISLGADLVPKQKPKKGSARLQSHSIEDPVEKMEDKMGCMDEAVVAEE